MSILASKARSLRPQAGVENAERRVWADMMNAITASGIVPESQIREFRERCGWEPQFDRATAMEQKHDD